MSRQRDKGLLLDGVARFQNCNNVIEYVMEAADHNYQLGQSGQKNILLLTITF
jgi:hypothetical protein